MSNEQQKPEVTEVETTKKMVGIVRFGKKGIGNPTPAILARATAGIRKLGASLIVILNGAPSTVISASITTVFSFWIGVIVAVSYTVDYITGVEQVDKD